MNRSPCSLTPPTPTGIPVPAPARTSAVALVVLLFATLATPQEGRAQEVRVGGSQAFPALAEMGNPLGWGWGVRYVRSGGIGVGLDREEYRNTRSLSRFVCNPDGTACAEEPVVFDTEMDLTTFLLLLQLAQGEEWGVRLGFGRVAGRMTGTGVGEETGRRLDPIPADAEAGILAWSRGADGTAVLLEVHRYLSVPGPFSLSATGSYRFVRAEMEGCESGEFSPFCGTLAMNELQLGFALALRSGRTR